MILAMAVAFIVASVGIVVAIAFGFLGDSERSMKIATGGVLAAVVGGLTLSGLGFAMALGVSIG